MVVVAVLVAAVVVIMVIGGVYGMEVEGLTAGEGGRVSECTLSISIL